MPSTVGRIVVASQTNKSGGSVAYGDVVITDAANDSSFTTTTSGGLTSAVIGVCVEPNGIASNATGRIQYQGECPQVNCNASVTRGNFVKTHTVAKQATGSASRTNGTFGVALTTSSTPKVLLYGLPDISASGNVAADTIWDAAGDLAVGSGADTAARLAIGATNGMVVSRVSGAVAWALPPGYEFDHVQVTSPVSISSTTAGSPDTLITGNAVSYDGSTVAMIEFFGNVLQWGAGGNNLFVHLYDGSTEVGRWTTLKSDGTSGNETQSIHLMRRLTPSNASHTYSVRAYFDFANTGTRQLQAGAGGNATQMPSFLRQYKV